MEVLMKDYVVTKNCYCHKGYDNPSVVMKDYFVRGQINVMSSDLSEIVREGF